MGMLCHPYQWYAQPSLSMVCSAIPINGMLCHPYQWVCSAIPINGMLCHPYQWVCSAIPKARMNFVAWVTSMQCYLRRVRILRSTVRWEPSCLMHNTSRFLESAAAAFKSVLFSRRAWQRVVMVSCQQRVVTITCPASGNGLQDTRRLHSRGCHNSVCITLVGGRVMHCRM